MNLVCTRKSFGKPCRLWVGLALLAGLGVAAGGSLAQEHDPFRSLLPTDAGQQSRSDGTGPARPQASRLPRVSQLPHVPQRDPRPAEGPTAAEQWQTEVAPDTPPTAGFVQPLQGNDAVIEVVVGQARLLRLRDDLVTERGTGVIAVADPSVLDFDVMPNPRLIRLIARRAGITDLSVTTADGEIYNFEVRGVYDLQLLHAQLRQLFPDVSLRLFQIGEHVAVEGQARSTQQVETILETLEFHLNSLGQTAAGQGGGSAGDRSPRAERGQRTDRADGPDRGVSDEVDIDTHEPDGRRRATQETGSRPSVRGTPGSPKILNLLRVPGVHQVMLQVRMAEVNRTGLREIGADILAVSSASGNIIGTKIGGGSVSAGALLGAGGLTGSAEGVAGAGSTAFGIFPSGDFEILLQALRRNSLLSVLAEPNLVAMSGQNASFLAGGEIAVPVPQASGGGTAVTIDWKDFGVQLDFLPIVLDDESVRLTVTPEVSSLDATLGTTVNGNLVPGLNTRRASTTVEMRQGQTLAIAGLLQVELMAQTNRIPGLGDLPYLGPFFSNTSHNRVEKELLVLVTPYLVAPIDADYLPPLPTDDLIDPTDLEFYLLNRIEGRTGTASSPTRGADDPWQFRRLMRLEQRSFSGPVGFSPIK